MTPKGTKFSLICRVDQYSTRWIMANYLLLRNNKESGPYSANDLMNLGLKAYDLLWIQGKSAAWRYPSEIDELKSFAPVVEEQPFDRFYKKSEPDVQQNANQHSITLQESKELKPIVEPKPIVEQKQADPIVQPQYEKYIPKKSVVVTMPGQKPTAVSRPVIKDEIAEPVTARPTITISENPAAAQIKYSQPLDEIKEMYVKTLHDRKKKFARKTFWMQNVKKATVVLLLVAIGLIAGFLLRPTKTRQVATVTPAEKQPASLPSNANAESTVTVKDSISSSKTVAEPLETMQATHQPTGGYVNKAPENKITVDKQKPDNQLLSSQLNNTNNSRKAPVTGDSGTQSFTNGFVAEKSDTDPVTGERTRKMRSANSEVNANRLPASPDTKSVSSVGDISNLVSVKSNEYKRVAFGGIRDLQLTVVNDSRYILDNVTVELQYIKPNELPLRTENIEFTSIGPNATSTIRVPDTNRGIKVTFRITKIKKRQTDERVADN